MIQFSYLTFLPTSCILSYGVMLVQIVKEPHGQFTVKTSCLIFPNTTGASHKFIVDVSNATIDSNSYHLVLGIIDYTGPNTYNDARHISVGFRQGSTGRNFSWLYRSGSVTINSNEQSGAIDVKLEAVNGGNILHLVGNWACGRQMKSA